MEDVVPPEAISLRGVTCKATHGLELSLFSILQRVGETKVPEKSFILLQDHVCQKD